MSSPLGYQAAHEPHATGQRDNVQKYEFDSPATIAKQQFQQAGGFPSQQGWSAPQPPALPRSRAAPLNRKNLALKTRDWSSQPWGGSKHLQGDIYSPPASLLDSSWSSLHPASSSSASSYSQGSFTGSSLPSTNLPSSTIPLQHNYHLPSSQLGQQSSTETFDAPLSKNYVQNSGFQNSGVQNAGFQNTGLPGSQNWDSGNQNWNSGSQDWNSSSIPKAPAFPSFFRARKWTRGPYRQRGLRTRNWGSRGEEGWSNFNRGIYAHESALPFNNRSRALNWDESSSSISQSSTVPISTAPISAAPISAPILQSSFSQSSIAPVAAPIAAAPLSQAIAPLVAPVGGRKGRRAAKRAAKQAAIQNKLTTQLTPPIGDPAVNAYRTGAHATVPLLGPNTGLAAPTGIAARHRGKRNNLGRRRNRTLAPALPVPATQPPFVAPVAAAPIALAPAPILAQPAVLPSATYRTLHSAQGAYPTTYSVQPQGSFFPASSAGIPLSTAGTTQTLYSSTAQQISPLSSTLTNAQGTVSNAPLYSAKEPVAAQLLQKQSQAPIISARPIGSATF